MSGEKSIYGSAVHRDVVELPPEIRLGKIGCETHCNAEQPPAGVTRPFEIGGFETAHLRFGGVLRQSFEIKERGAHDAFG